MAITDSGATTRVSGSAPFIFVTAGGAWLAGDLIACSGTAYVQADDNAGLFAQWIAATDAASGAVHQKLYRTALCKAGRYSGGTVGAPLYASDTAGRVSETAGSSSTPVGVVVEADTVFLCPTIQKVAALAFNVPFFEVLGADGADTAITETAGDFYRSIGTNQLLLLGEISNGTVGADTEASVGWFRFQLPHNYVAGGTITIRAGVKVVGSGALGTCTIDFSAYLQSGTAGTVGSDLVTTSATAISGTAGNKDFTVSPTGLVAGDILIVKMTSSVDNTDSTAIQAQISRLDVLCDVKV